MHTAHLFLICWILCRFVVSNEAFSSENNETSQREPRFFPVDFWFDGVWQWTSDGLDLDSDEDDDEIDIRPVESTPAQQASGLSHQQTSRHCGHCKCGHANTGRHSRLIGGTDLLPFEYPWLVQVQTFGLTVVPGTLINDRYVLTAASALKHLTPVDLKVIVGAHDICQPDTTSTILSVHAVRPHPEFAERTRQNDIALLRLAVPVQFNAHVAPICLPKWPRPPPSSPTKKRKRRLHNVAGEARHYSGRVSVIASWLRGKLLANLSISDTSCLPRQVGLPVLEVAACLESAAASQGCLGVIGAPSLLCEGDVGAGVMVQRRRPRRRWRPWRTPEERRKSRKIRYKQSSASRGRYVLIGVLSDRQYCEASVRKVSDNSIAWEEVQSFHGGSLPMYTKVTGDRVMWWIERNTRDACYCGR